MKSPYSRFIKYILKTQEIKIQKKEGCYFIANRCVLVKVPEYEYKSFFQPESGIFISLENGEIAQCTSTQRIPEKLEGGDICSVFTNYKAEQPIMKTAFMYERTVGKKTALVRVFITRNDAGETNHISVQEDFIKAVSDFCGEFYGNGEKQSLLKWEDDIGHGIIMCPMSDNGAIQKFITKATQ